MQLQRLNEYNQNEACSDPALVIALILCTEALFALRSLLLNNIFIKVGHKVGNRDISWRTPESTDYVAFITAPVLS